MERCIEQQVEEPVSMEGIDSNAEILPARRKNKRQILNQVEPGKTEKLSKSRKRKLKKMEEEKEKALLFSKSMEMLEKYKLQGDAYSLLRSSKSIGRAETKLEKRRRAMQFSKAGLAIPVGDESLERSNGRESSNGHQSCITDDNQEQQMIVDREVLTQTSVPLDSHGNEPITSGGFCNTISMEEVSGKFNYMSEQECIGNTNMNSSAHDVREQSNVTEKPVDNQSVDHRSNKDPSDCSPRGPAVAPCVIHVSRPSDVEEKRKDLPIVMMEQEIMEAINYNSSVIICGETGCGKTTQVPQFLYEAGFGSKQFSARRGIIGVTQPRRVAVLATAKRVAFELGLPLGKEVGFQVRHDRKIGENSSIKFMTDGILLREVQNDMLLRRYSVIILDEAHERSLNTDILIGMLSRVIRVRQHYYEQQQKLVQSGQSISPENMIFPIKLVLMSATLRVEDFVSGKRLFHEPPPVIEVPTRQFPVTLHFSKRTEIFDYVGQAYKKVMSIHKKLPQGGILVFVTGQREVEYLCQKLRKASKELIARSSQKESKSEAINGSETHSYQGIDMKEINEAFQTNGSSHHQTDRFDSHEGNLSDIEEDDISEQSYDSETDSEWETINDDWNSRETNSLNDDGNDNLESVLREDGSLASLKAAFEALSGQRDSTSHSLMNGNIPDKPTHSSEKSITTLETTVEEAKEQTPCALCVLPLYAMLPAAAQLCVFEEVKEGERLVVVATNVAETSLTIPGIKYVVDTGREKVKNYNPSNGIETYDIQWISKASASQRSGRAGRTGPGHCYRLYSSAVFNNIFHDFSCAEISKVPVDGVVLLLKSMHISKVANFPFPTPPEAAALVEAERCLRALEALDTEGHLTLLGKAMAYYPMSPRHSRMLLTIIQIMRDVKTYTRANLILAYAVATAAALSLSNPFIMQLEGTPIEKDASKNNADSNAGESDKSLKAEKHKKKKLREAAREARAKFSNPSSDALTVAFALQSFELSESPAEFCNENALHLKTMEEMSKLRKQLLQLVINRNKNPELDHDFSWSHGTLDDVETSWRVVSNKIPLLQNEEELLAQAICAGWADRVAKRIRGVEKLTEGDRKATSARYTACMVQETVFLHRWSSLSSSAPEFLVYSELLHTKRPYMHGATRVKSDWLVKYSKSLCSFSAPLTDPKPYYEPREDKVYCWVTPTFGPHLWELPLHNLPIASTVHRVAVFAYSLLEGHVLPCLRTVRKFMAAPPATILRPEASGQKRVGNLLRKLKAKTIDSCATLRKAWDQNPTTLQSEILDWFQEGSRSHFEELWSEMLREVHLGPEERFPKWVKKDKLKKSKLGVE